MRKRAQAHDETRERILRATMTLHDRQGIVATTFSDVAAEAGVGPATVARHFPSMDVLVQSCGAHVWQEMRPLMPADAAAYFARIERKGDRQRRLIEEVDGLYERGAHRFRIAYNERSRLVPLDAFLGAVEAGVEEWTREAFRLERPAEEAIQVALVLLRFPVWDGLAKLKPIGQDRRELIAVLLEAGMKAEA